MNKYTYYDKNGVIFSIKVLKDNEEAELNIGRAAGFVKGSYPAHMYKIENGKPIIKASNTTDPRNPVWPVAPN